MSTTGSPPPGAPPGPPPDLPHDSLQANIIVCSVLTWAIAALFVALRFYTRVAIIKAVTWSDWCILVSLVRHRVCPAAARLTTGFGMDADTMTLGLLGGHERRRN